MRTSLLMRMARIANRSPERQSTFMGRRMPLKDIGSSRKCCFCGNRTKGRREASGLHPSRGLDTEYGVTLV
jgi:hypothetical protein